jgi:hypothetical protein
MVNKKWNCLKVIANTHALKMNVGSIEEFIFEHYYGYTKVNTSQSIEYKVNHPSWNVNEIKDYTINCNFCDFYGKDFEILNSTKSHSIMLAEGSAVSIDWKRHQF